MKTITLTDEEPKLGEVWKDSKGQLYVIKDIWQLFDVCEKIITYEEVLTKDRYIMSL